MTWRGLLPALLLLAGCRDQPAASTASGAGQQLERAAVAAGLVIDPSSAPLVGAYVRDGDQLCLVPGVSGAILAGVAADYGEGQRCRGRGAARRTGNRVELRFGTCRVAARFDGERIAFPAELPEACDALCGGRASLAALDLPRLSEAVSEARLMRDGEGRLLCPG